MCVGGCLWEGRGGGRVNFGGERREREGKSRVCDSGGRGVGRPGSKAMCRERTYIHKVVRSAVLHIMCRQTHRCMRCSGLSVSVVGVQCLEHLHLCLVRSRFKSTMFTILYIETAVPDCYNAVGLCRYRLMKSEMP